MTHSRFIVFVGIISLVVPRFVIAAPLQVVEYSSCDKFFGMLSCNQQTEVCAINPTSGNPGCLPKSQAGNYVDYYTRYSDQATCNQKSNCPYPCSENPLAIPSTYFCSSTGSPPSGAVPNTSNQPNGASCQYHNECYSGYCNPSLNKCEVKPTSGPLPPGSVPSGTLPPGTAPTSQNGNGTSITLTDPLGAAGASLSSFLNAILDLAIQIGSVVVILMLVYVGFLFVVAQGNETKLTEARKALLWTVVGALILLGAKAIAIGIQATVEALSVGK